MSRKITTGIDIGTQSVKVIVVDQNEKNERGLPKIIATGISESHGIRHGYPVDMPELIESIKEAVSQAEEKSDLKIKKAFLGVGGIGLSSVLVQTSLVTTRADAEITPLDIKKLHEQAEKDIPQAHIANRRIIYDIPIQYSIDGSAVLGNPEGMRGNKIDLKILFVTCIEQHVSNIIQAVNEAGIEVVDVMASPIAGGFATLSKTQKIAGCALVNIGAETTSVAVFENNMPVSLEVFPIGGSDITNDIALGLKISLEEAEQIKIGAITGSSFPKKKLDEIIAARLSDIFDLIEKHLRKIGRSGLLPAGIILVGGGAGSNGIEILTKAYLKLPSKIGSMTNQAATAGSKDILWTTAYGICIWGMRADDGSEIDQSDRFWVNLWKATRSSIKKFLP